MRTLRETVRGTSPAEHMSLGLRSFGVYPGGHAEVAAITSKGLLGHQQRGVLLITAPGEAPVSALLRNKSQVARALAFAARYNARAAQAERGL